MLANGDSDDSEDDEEEEEDLQSLMKKSGERKGSHETQPKSMVPQGGNKQGGGGGNKQGGGAQGQQKGAIQQKGQ